MTQKSGLRVVLEPVLLACVLAFAVRAMVRIYSVPSASMTPTLQPGDRILVTRMITDTAARGDVIVFRNPAGRDLTVKRVIAIGGDLIDSDAGRIRIDGKMVDEPYVAASEPAADIPAQVVPAGHLFVAGDNRTESFDSRHWGALPEHLVVGRARIILWQSRRTSGRPPASRIFKWIE